MEETGRQQFGQKPSRQNHARILRSELFAGFLHHSREGHGLEQPVLARNVGRKSAPRSGVVPLCSSCGDFSTALFDSTAICFAFPELAPQIPRRVEKGEPDESSPQVESHSFRAIQRDKA